MKYHLLSYPLWSVSMKKGWGQRCKWARNLRGWGLLESSTTRLSLPSFLISRHMRLRKSWKSSKSRRNLYLPRLLHKLKRRKSKMLTLSLRKKLITLKNLSLMPRMKVTKMKKLKYHQWKLNLQVNSEKGLKLPGVKKRIFHWKNRSSLTWLR